LAITVHKQSDTSTAVATVEIARLMQHIASSNHSMLTLTLRIWNERKTPDLSRRKGKDLKCSIQYDKPQQSKKASVTAI